MIGSLVCLFRLSRVIYSGFQVLGALGITKSHSRPHVSNDNPYSESQFKTLKYSPSFPGQFGSGDEELETFREKIHDISLVVGNVQQRFTQWFNKRNDRWGKLFGGRFESVLVDQNCAIAKMMAYITLNPVRAGIVMNLLSKDGVVTVNVWPMANFKKMIKSLLAICFMN